MAAVAASGASLGRPASTVRILALGVTAILLVDPLLATSLGFRLSVAGAAGIVVGAARLEPALPGPRWLATPLSVTLAAQLAVAPLLVAAFGAVPVASLPANLLALPAAGPAMVWGLTAGLVAGMAGDGVATVVHVPTRALLAWIDGVATAAARWPLGELHGQHIAWLVVAALAAVAARCWMTSDAETGPEQGPWLPARSRHWGASLTQGAAGLVALAVLVQVAADDAGPVVVDGEAVGSGATLWQAGGAAVVVVDGRAADEAVLAGLRDRGVARLDVVVLRTAARGAADVAATMRRRWPGVAVLGPAGSASAPTRGDGDGGDGRITVPPAGAAVDLGGLRLTVTVSAAERLEVQIELRDLPSESARSPPPAGR
jgi:competence protein ComEC